MSKKISAEKLVEIHFKDLHRDEVLQYIKLDKPLKSHILTKAVYRRNLSNIDLNKDSLENEILTDQYEQKQVLSWSLSKSANHGDLLDVYIYANHGDKVVLVNTSFMYVEKDKMLDYLKKNYKKNKDTFRLGPNNENLFKGLPNWRYILALFLGVFILMAVTYATTLIF